MHYNKLKTFFKNQKLLKNHDRVLKELHKQVREITTVLYFWNDLLSIYT